MEFRCPECHVLLERVEAWRGWVCPDSRWQGLILTDLGLTQIAPGGN